VACTSRKRLCGCNFLCGLCGWNSSAGDGDLDAAGHATRRVLRRALGPGGRGAAANFHLPSLFFRGPTMPRFRLTNLHVAQDPSFCEDWDRGQFFPDDVAAECSAWEAEGLGLLERLCRTSEVGRQLIQAINRAGFNADTGVSDKLLVIAPCPEAADATDD